MSCPKAEIADLCSVSLRIPDGIDHILFFSYAKLCAKSLQNHQLYILIVRNSGNSRSLSRCCNRPCCMGSVGILFPCVNLITVVKKVPAIYIIHKTILIIVNAIIRYLILIDPDASLQIRMTYIYSCINHSYRYRPTGLCTGIILIPGRKHININAFSRCDFRLLISVRSGNRGWKSQLIRHINMSCQFRIAVLKTVFNLYILKLSVIFQCPLITGIRILNREIFLAGSKDADRKIILMGRL